MAIAINREALAELIASQTNNPNFNIDDIDESILAGLAHEEEVEEVEEVEETEEAEESEEAEETEEVIEDEEEINPLDGVDPNKLSATERMFYDYVVAEKEKAKKREVSLIIQGSQLDIKHKMILDRMAKDGVSRKLIESTIEDLKQIQASSVRVGGTKIVSKSKLKTKTTPAKDDKIPKMGTREYGVYLANLRKTKKI